MFRNNWLCPLATCVALFVGSDAVAQSADTPESSNLTNKVYTPDWDGICAEGATLGDGCDAIREREIVDAAAAPWRAIGRVNYASTRLRGHCTGTLVGERVVVTAAHCLYNTARRSWLPAESILFAAGYQRGGFAAMSRVEHYVVDPVQDTTSAEFRGDPTQDWALLVLVDPIGLETGYLDLRALDDEALWAAELIFAGYPSLRKHVLSVERDCGGADHVLGGRLLVQQCAVMRGDSGGPVLAVEDGKPALAGVLSGVIQDGTVLMSGSVPVAIFADALRQELGPDAMPAEIEALPATDAPGTTPAPAEPAPSLAPEPTYPPTPPVGR